MYNLNEIVNKSGLTPHGVAKKAGIDHTVIYKILSGERKDIYLSSAIKIADALEISLDEFRKE